MFEKEDGCDGEPVAYVPLPTCSDGGDSGDEGSDDAPQQGVKRVLSLDPATSLGWCVLDIFPNGSVEVVAWGYVELKGDEAAEKLCDLECYANSIYKRYEPGYTVMEGYMFSKRCCNGALLNAYIRGVLMLVATKHNQSPTVVQVGDWKRFICGAKGMKAKKEEVIEKLVMRGCVFPDKIYSQNSKAKIKFRHDISDAVGIALYYLCSKHQVQSNRLELTLGRQVLLPPSTRLCESLFPASPNTTLNPNVLVS